MPEITFRSYYHEGTTGYQIIYRVNLCAMSSLFTQSVLLLNTAQLALRNLNYVITHLFENVYEITHTLCVFALCLCWQLFPRL